MHPANCSRRRRLRCPSGSLSEGGDSNRGAQRSGSSHPGLGASVAAGRPRTSGVPRLGFQGNRRLTRRSDGQPIPWLANSGTSRAPNSDDSSIRFASPDCRRIAIGILRRGGNYGSRAECGARGRSRGLFVHCLSGLKPACALLTHAKDVLVQRQDGYVRLFTYSLRAFVLACHFIETKM